MRSIFFRAALVLAALVVGFGAEARAQYDRRNAIVEAVDKTRNGIVALTVTTQDRREIAGTGIIVDERGYLVTNHHVVKDAGKVVATLADKSTLSAEVYDTIPNQDLAILKVSGKKKLQALTFAPGSDLKVGETVIAIGNPFGYSNTVSTGIISALGRDITMPSGAKLLNLTQHSASINPGNSGGPLLNINGELIGINVALRHEAQGIAFALNSDTVQRVLARKLKASLDHGLGLREEVVADAGKDRQTVVVTAVEASSPAAAAGLKKGDVILAVGTRSVANRFDLERALWGYKAGDKIEAAIIREGKQTQVSMTLSRPNGTHLTAAAATTNGR
jgi:serine protease Do